ncbi:hypothetical protein ACHAXA_004966 [Cyclostephanos tholiformis]|uniref:Uncharacterized protein n=1 Tax=Cyclostephanos tholiformis TaxID=382380 RepID=A0ABD3R5Q8_9STRA
MAGAMRSVIRALDVVEAKLRSLLDSDVIVTSIPTDGMIRDWSDHRRDLTRPLLSHFSLSDAGASSSIGRREVWGPSRHAFLGDLESLMGLMLFDGVKETSTKEMTKTTMAKTSSMVGGGEGMAINPDEWHDRVRCIVSSMDVLARRLDGGAEKYHSTSTSWSTSPMKTTMTYPMCSSLSRNVATSSAINAASPSVADVARSYVERVLLRGGDGSSTAHRGDPSLPNRRRGGEWTEGSLSATERTVGEEDLGLRVEPLDLRSVIDDEGGERDHPTPPWIWEGQGPADEIEVDAFRLAMAFGSNAAADYDNNATEGGTKASARKTIERRLETLVRKVKNVGLGRHYTGPNINGAPFYLESLLRTLMRPPDPGVWSRLIEESGGADIALTLRRGRTSLVSFLIAIDSPGWKDAVALLASSPVPSYLGYLSPSEDFRSSRRREKEQVVHRTSYFLPAVESGDKTLPPSPMVTEVGLSMCVRNFLHGDVPRGGSQASYASGEGKSGGVEVFRNFGPLQSACTNSCEKSLRFIRAPLADANELAFDLFDLTLRLAADDDSEHESKPFPLRLATPSASESLAIILRVVLDHSDWLSPVAIAPRYRFVLQRIIISFHCLGEEINVLKRPSDNSAESHNEDFRLWSKRASFLIEATKIPNRGKIALFTTQFMIMICSRKWNGSFQNPNQSHFYDRLQLDKSSSFWVEIDRIDTNVSSDVLARVLDRNFATSFLLPLAFRCTLLLATSSIPSDRNESISAETQGVQSVQSLIMILSSVLDVLADNGLLRGCIHMGWAVRILAASISHFIYGEDYHFRNREKKTLSDCNDGSNSVWECLSCQLNNLYFSIWGIDWHSYISLCDSQTSAQKCIYYESKGNTRMMVLLPPLDIFFASLIEFVCNLRSQPDGVEGFCQFNAIILFDFYMRGLKRCTRPTSGCDDIGFSYQCEFSLLSYWLAALTSNLQEIVCHQVFGKGNNIERNEKAVEALTEEVLNDLTTPLLKALHRHIMGRMSRSLPPRRQNETDFHGNSSELVASIFVRLHKQEIEQIVKNPASEKARLVYRKCIKKIFFLTPPNCLFACHGYFAVTENAAGILTEICNIFGQFDLSQSIFIMVAAALYIGARAQEMKFLQSHHQSQVGLLCQDDLSRQSDLLLRLKQLYENFSSSAKNCIIDSIRGADRTTLMHMHSQNKLNNLVWGVRRELTLRGEIESALEWWNEISVDIFLLFNESNYQALDNNKLDATSKNILTACSTLQNYLSVIASNSNQV